jgi:hypothetical protein
VLGVWAAGNVTNPRAQVITAAGEGSAMTKTTENPPARIPPVHVSDAVPKSRFSVRSSVGHSMRSAFAKRR